MAQPNGNMGSMIGIWGIGLIGGAVIGVVLGVLGTVSWTGAVFVAILLAVVVGGLVSWMVARPLPTLREVSAERAAAATSGEAAGVDRTTRSQAPARNDVAASASPMSAAAATSPVAEPARDTTPQPAPTTDPATETVLAADPAVMPASAPAPTDQTTPAPQPAPAPADAAPVPAGGTKPALLTAARAEGADDLKEIKGVGPKLENTLNDMGVYHFDQIASWGPAELAWVDDNLEGFKGRASRDDWVPQAKILAAGGDTDFSRKVDKGDVY